MLIFFTLLLVVSIVAMTLMLALKHRELSTGTFVFGSVRPRVSAALQRAVLLLEKILPSLLREYLAAGMQKLRTFTHHSLAQSVLYVEQSLEKALRIVREKTAPERAPGEASAFLREVADHKKKLLHRTRRTIAPTHKVVGEPTETSALKEPS